MQFQGVNYELNQCADLIEWIQESKVGEYTNYYDKVAFHTSYGFIAAYADNLANYWSF